MFEYVIEPDGTERICRLDPLPFFETVLTPFVMERHPYDDVSDLLVYKVSHQESTLIIQNRKDLYRIDKFLRKGSIQYSADVIDPILRRTNITPQENLYIQEACDYCFCYPLSAKATKIDLRLPQMKEFLSPGKRAFLPPLVDSGKTDDSSEALTPELDF